MKPSPTQRRGPMWGNFIGHADDDLIAAALLYVGGSWELPYYHAQQAVEKYMKALAIAIKDPDGTSRYDEHRKWIEKSGGHNLVNLAGFCSPADPFYAEPSTLAVLEKVQEWDQCTRYPWVETQHYGKGRDYIRMVSDLVLHLRGMDLPIIWDDYILGGTVRGYHHRHAGVPWSDLEPARSQRERQLAALQDTFDNVERFVRWPESRSA